mgnify:CR=1 FL=1
MRKGLWRRADNACLDDSNSYRLSVVANDKKGLSTVAKDVKESSAVGKDKKESERS